MKRFQRRNRYHQPADVDLNTGDGFDVPEQVGYAFLRRECSGAMSAKKRLARPPQLTGACKHTIVIDRALIEISQATISTAIRTGCSMQLEPHERRKRAGYFDWSLRDGNACESKVHCWVTDHRVCSVENTAHTSVVDQNIEWLKIAMAYRDMILRRPIGFEPGDHGLQLPKLFLDACEA